VILPNQSHETVVDLVTDDYHELAKRAKDAAAGAVLVTSAGCSHPRLSGSFPGMFSPVSL